VERLVDDRDLGQGGVVLVHATEAGRAHVHDVAAGLGVREPGAPAAALRAVVEEEASQELRGAETLGVQDGAQRLAAAVLKLPEELLAAGVDEPAGGAADRLGEEGAIPRLAEAGS
jgi:hypothetical protein